MQTSFTLAVDQRDELYEALKLMIAIAWRDANQAAVSEREFLKWPEIIQAHAAMVNAEKSIE